MTLIASHQIGGDASLPEAPPLDLTGVPPGRMVIGLQIAVKRDGVWSDWEQHLDTDTPSFTSEISQ